MCKASIEVRVTRDGEEGDRLSISPNQYGLGVAHLPGTSPLECAVCLSTGTSLLVSDIPEAVRLALKVQETERITFVETDGSEVYVIHDLVTFDKHPSLPPVPLAVLVGSRVEVLSVPEMELDASDLFGHDIDDVLVTDEDQLTLARQYGEMRLAA